MTVSLKNRSFLSISDLIAEELSHVLSTAAKQKKGKMPQVLAGKSIALLFEKPSLRTKASFDVAVDQLGGHPIYFGPQEIGLGQRESISDVAQTTSRFVQGIIARVFTHSSIVELTKHSTVPVINALSDGEHPCQALADLLTIHEKKGGLKGVRIAFIGDGNNVASSLAQGACMLGADFVIASPVGYELPKAVQTTAKKSGGSFLQVTDPKDAVKGADVVYTDVWASMGQEKDSAQRANAFKGYGVTSELMALAKKDAIFMHDLPAHRGEEVTDAVIDSKQSVVFDQAENRLHAQRALLSLIFAK